MAAKEWSYSGPTGPDHWMDLFPICGGQKQSPINIAVPSTVHDDDMGAFTFTKYDTATGYTMTLTNNGHSAQINLNGAKADMPSISDGGLTGTFRAAQFHFHWGSVDTQGSEHTIDSNRFAIEMHIVHFNDKYNSLGDAVDKADGLAVLGINLEVGAVHTGLNPVTVNLPSVVATGASISLTPFPLNQLFGSMNKNKFYRYPGSLTTPGCHESVTWTVFDEILTLSSQQIGAFRSLKDAAGNPLVDNFRPLQAINARTIYSSWDIDSSEK